MLHLNGYRINKFLDVAGIFKRPQIEQLYFKKAPCAGCLPHGIIKMEFRNKSAITTFSPLPKK
jgi:hypothetical protein